MAMKIPTLSETRGGARGALSSGRAFVVPSPRISSATTIERFGLHVTDKTAVA